MPKLISHGSVYLNQDNPLEAQLMVSYGSESQPTDKAGELLTDINEAFSTHLVSDILPAANKLLEKIGYYIRDIAYPDCSFLPAFIFIRIDRQPIKEDELNRIRECMLPLVGNPPRRSSRRLSHPSTLYHQGSDAAAPQPPTRPTMRSSGNFS